jgi:hypothetical protein
MNELFSFTNPLAARKRLRVFTFLSLLVLCDWVLSTARASMEHRHVKRRNLGYNG